MVNPPPIHLSLIFCIVWNEEWQLVPYVGLDGMENVLHLSNREINEVEEDAG